MFWKKPKKYHVCFWFSNDEGQGIGQMDITCNDGVFRPGDVIDAIKQNEGFKELAIINAIRYKEWKKVHK